jgi:D-inositol-3-phosphate glycosyltransferase
VGDAGLLVAIGDEDALATALCRFLDDSALRATLAARARPRASSFSWDRAADATLEVYRKIAR